MRGFKGAIEGMARALPRLRAAGVYSSADLGVNRNMGGDGAALSRNDFQTPGGGCPDRFETTHRPARDAVPNNALTPRCHFW
ncbi:MAG: hypothetical protein GY859_02140 [Desulfobacterales bacterium]|nr:hypothetical protein [Desulfobacterales bacterium]